MSDPTIHDQAGATNPAEPSRPSPARMYDYYLGGTHNYEIDRMAAERIRAVAPMLEDSAWANRGFHQRAARWLASDVGITQFIDVGSGLPTQNNTHDIVLAVNPDARVVYADNDPSVLEYLDLLADIPNAAFVQADLRDPDALLGHPDLRALIDFEKPVAYLMSAVLHFVHDDNDPHGLVRRYLDAVVPGSYLALSHGTDDKGAEDRAAEVADAYKQATEHLYFRTYDQVSKFFEGLEVVPPYNGAKAAVTFASLWAAEDPEAADDEGGRYFYSAVARKP